MQILHATTPPSAQYQYRLTSSSASATQDQPSDLQSHSANPTSTSPNLARLVLVANSAVAGTRLSPSTYLGNSSTTPGDGIATLPNRLCTAFAVASNNASRTLSLHGTCVDQAAPRIKGV
jgi:hypothetical protein